MEEQNLQVEKSPPEVEVVVEGQMLALLLCFLIFMLFLVLLLMMQISMLFFPSF